MWQYYNGCRGGTKHLHRLDRFEKKKNSLEANMIFWEKLAFKNQYWTIYVHSITSEPSIYWIEEEKLWNLYCIAAIQIIKFFPIMVVTIWHKFGFITVHKCLKQITELLVHFMINNSQQILTLSLFHSFVCGWEVLSPYYKVYWLLTVQYTTCTSFVALQF